MIARLFGRDGCELDGGGDLTVVGRNKRRADQAQRQPPTRPQTQYRIATSLRDLISSYELVYQSYRRQGLTFPNRHRKRVSMFHCSETTDVFIATERDQVICTMTLIGDSEMGIPLETLYSDQVNLKRRQGLRIAEVGALAQRESGKFSVLLRLIQLMAQRAKNRYIDELLIAVHPRHVKFYQGFLSFEPIGPCRTYNAVCDQPAVGMALNLSELPLRNHRAGRRMFGEPFPRSQIAAGPLSYELRDEIYDLAVEIIDKGNSSPRDARQLVAVA